GGAGGLRRALHVRVERGDVVLDRRGAVLQGAGVLRAIGRGRIEILSSAVQVAHGLVERVRGLGDGGGGRRRIGEAVGQPGGDLLERVDRGDEILAGLLHPLRGHAELVDPVLGGADGLVQLPGAVGDLSRAVGEVPGAGGELLGAGGQLLRPERSGCPFSSRVTSPVRSSCAPASSTAVPSRSVTAPALSWSSPTTRSRLPWCRVLAPSAS